MSMSHSKTLIMVLGLTLGLFDQATAAQIDQAAPHRINDCKLHGHEHHSKWDEIMEKCTNIIELGINEFLVSAYIVRCAVYIVKRQPQLAIQDCDKAIAFDPESAEAYRHRGSAYAYLNSFDKAYADLSKAIELDPEDARSFNNRASLLLSLGRHQEAAADANSTIAIDPTIEDAYLTRALIWAMHTPLRFSPVQ